jgi:hypothetical protein
MIDVRIGGGLLRGHVCRRADGDARGRESLRCSARFADRLRHAEVGHQDMTSGEQHVVGFDVPMDYAACVRVGKCVRDLAQEPNRLGNGELPLPCQPGAQGFAVDERHDVIEETVGVSGVEDGQNVGVLKLRGDLDFAGEPVGSERGG